jgi:hypothetical protein
MKEPRFRTDAAEALYALDQIARFEHVGVAPSPDLQLDIGKIIEEGNVLYVHVPTVIYGGAARSIATFTSHSINVEAAQRFENPDLEPRVIHEACDEYGEVAAGRTALASSLCLAAKWGVMKYMAFQSRQQANTPDGDLHPVICDNCLRFVFDAWREEDQRELMYYSQDELKQIVTPSHHASYVPSSNVQQYWAPRLERNKILEISAKPMWLFGLFRPGYHVDPTPFEIIPPTTRDEHAILKRQPLPPKSKVSSGSVDLALTNQSDASSALQTALAELYATKMAAMGRAQHGHVQADGGATDGSPDD